MKSWKENRIAGWIALVLAVLIGVFGIGSMKISGLADKTEKKYSELIAQDLTKRTAAAENLLAVGQEVLGADAVCAVRVQEALDALEAAGDPAEAFEADTALTSAVGLLYEETRAAKGGEKGSVLQTQWSEFVSRGKIISRSAEEYNKSARAAQKKLSGFPAFLIAKLTGVQIAEFAPVR